MIQLLSISAALTSLTGLISTAHATAAAASIGYRNHNELSIECQRLDAAYGECAVDTIGASRDGRGLFLLTLSSVPDDAASRPALLIVAGIDGRHLVGTETAIRVAERLLQHHAELLRDVTVYIVPRVNPDAAELNLGPINAGIIGTTRQVDADRDGAIDEDGPDDLNGDGIITMMRRLSPPLDDPPTHLADPMEPRLLRTPQSLKGHVPIFSLYAEGIDNDGDGLYNEDAPGFVDLDRNFMHMWPEHDLDAGPHQLSEPESLALARFVIDHPNIVAAVVFGRHDNLINVPSGKAKDETGQSPRDIDAGDVELYQSVADLFKEATGLTRAPQVGIEGSFHAWLYAQRGVPAFATVVWTRPDLEKDSPKDSNTEDREGEARDGAPADPGGTWSGSLVIPDAGTELPFTVELERSDDASISGSFNALGNRIELQGTAADDTASLSGAATVADQSYSVDVKVTGEQLSGSVSGPGGMNAPFTAQRTSRDAGGAHVDSKDSKSADDKPADEDAAAWLKYSDDMRNGEGFVAWTPFDHPTLGAVEIGGFIPGFQMNPPATELDELAAKHTDFIVSLASKRPRLHVVGPEVSRLASGLYRIRFAITNEGLIPTVTSMSAQARAVTPIIVRLSVPIENIVAGERVARIWAINGSGGRSTHEWIVRAADHSQLDIVIESAQLGRQIVPVLTFESTPTGEAPPPQEISP